MGLQGFGGRGSGLGSGAPGPGGYGTDGTWVRFLWSCRRWVCGGLRPVTFGLSGIRVGQEGHDGWFAGGGVVRAVAGGVRAGAGMAGRAGGGGAGSRGG